MKRMKPPLRSGFVGRPRATSEKRIPINSILKGIDTFRSRIYNPHMTKTYLESKSLLFTALALASATCATALAQDDSYAQFREELDAMRAENQAMHQEIATMRAQHGDKWLTEARAEEIRSLVKDVVADADMRTSLQGSGATSGYSNGFFIASADGNFRLDLDFLAQERFTWNYRPGANIGTVPALSTTFIPTESGTGEAQSQWGFESRRTQMAFAGNLLNPSWTYMACLNYGSAVDPYTPEVGQPVLQDGWIAKDFDNGVSLKVGQFKSPFMAESLRADGAQLSAERSVVDYYFSGGYTQGILISFAQEKWRVMGTYNNGPRSQNTTWAGGSLGAISTNNSVSAGARAELVLAGAWSQFANETSTRSDETGLRIGAAVQYYNNRGGSSGTGYYPQVPSPVYGSELAFDRFTTTGALDWTADITYKSGGLSLTGAFVGASYGMAVSTTGVPPFGAPTTNYQSYGAVVQGGYRFADSLEAFARGEWYNVANAANTPSSNTGLDATDVNTIVTVGANVYMGANIKWTSQFGFSFASTVGSNSALNLTGAGYQQDANTQSKQQMNFITQLQFMF